jgi:uncharacterized protein YjiS (DUF1127 family)
MPALTTGFSNSAGKTLASRLLGAFDPFRTRPSRPTVASLAELDDHILKDIGLTQSVILSRVNGSRTERT